MSEIFLTKEISNETFDGNEGFLDRIDREISNIPDGEDLEMVISSGGGSTHGGSRLSRKISEHNGKTKAFVTGIAASMAGVLLTDFDEVVMDHDAKVMLHKARYADTDDLTNEQKEEIEDFNKKAYDKILNKITTNSKPEHLKENISLLNDIFLDDNINKDFTFNSEDALRFGIVDEVTKVSRENGQPVITKLVAMIKDNTQQAKIIYNKYKMGLFNKDKKENLEVARTAVLKNEAGVESNIVFNSVVEELQKGDNVAVIGSGDKAAGTVALSEGKEAVIIDGVVQEIVDAKPESKDEIIAKLEARITALEASKEASEEKEVTEEVAKEGLENSVAALLDALKGKQLVSSYKLPNTENKQEAVMTGTVLTDVQEKAEEYKKVLNQNKG